MAWYLVNHRDNFFFTYFTYQVSNQPNKE